MSIHVNHDTSKRQCESYSCSNGGVYASTLVGTRPTLRIKPSVYGCTLYSDTTVERVRSVWTWVPPCVYLSWFTSTYQASSLTKLSLW